MYIPKINNLEITKVTDDILHIHQIKTPFHFSCCDGLLILPKEGRNSSIIALDLNIEPDYVYIIKEVLGPVSDYVCTHGHMDHIAHVYAWEEYGATIHAPVPENKCLLDLRSFYESFGFQEMVKYKEIEEFAELNGYNNCEKTKSYYSGDKLKFENLEVETILFQGHSKSHAGLFLPEEKILHISCLGFDQSELGDEGFGPWYGFKECSIELYLNDIDRAEIIFLEGAEFLTSSHSYIVKHPDKTPFEYMRRKIRENQKRIDMAIANLKLSPNFEEKVEKILKQDLFFPKKKMKGALKRIYTLWENWIIIKHLQRSKLLQL